MGCVTLTSFLCSIQLCPLSWRTRTSSRQGAMIMSVAGGILIYGTIISFGMFFQEEQEF